MEPGSGDEARCLHVCDLIDRLDESRLSEDALYAFCCQAPRTRTYMSTVMFSIVQRIASSSTFPVKHPVIQRVERKITPSRNYRLTAPARLVFTIAARFLEKLRARMGSARLVISRALAFFFDLPVARCDAMVRNMFGNVNPIKRARPGSRQEKKDQGQQEEEEEEEAEEEEEEERARRKAPRLEATADAPAAAAAVTVASLQRQIKNLSMVVTAQQKQILALCQNSAALEQHLHAIVSTLKSHPQPQQQQQQQAQQQQQQQLSFSALEMSPAITPLSSTFVDEDYGFDFLSQEPYPAYE